MSAGKNRTDVIYDLQREDRPYRQSTSSWLNNACLLHLYAAEATCRMESLSTVSQKY